jgi:hypothetical protein
MLSSFGVNAAAAFFIASLAFAWAIGTPRKLLAVSARSITSPSYLFNFNQAGTLVEAGSQDSSTSPYWWVNSGGKMVLKDGKGATAQGSLGTSDPWRAIYNNSNAYDTDNGTHPQNIFRLVTRSKWQDMEQEAYFKINKDNMSASSNRNQSNGLLLFNRYQDGQSLYYTGVRVDGSAIIKKKLNGTYYTMAEVKGTFGGSYNRTSSPNLIPKNKWIGIKSQVTNESGGKVRIKVFMDEGQTGNWKLIAEAVDDGVKYGKPITNSGYGGIRTDFMDVEFENFRLKNI